MSLRRAYHRHVRHHHRFNIAVVLTMIAVAWIIVPAVARFVDTMGTYDPRVYEPKDVQRGEWIANHPSIPLEGPRWKTALKLALLVFAAVAWLAVSSPGTRAGESRRTTRSGSGPSAPPGPSGGPASRR